LNKEWAKERSHEAYAKNYSIVYKNDEPLAGRNQILSPFHSRLAAAGCVYQERQGHERPGYFNQSDEPVNVQVLPYE
jgi:sarcosine dehydrogenase